MMEANHGVSHCEKQLQRIGVFGVLVRDVGPRGELNLGAGFGVSLVRVLLVPCNTQVTPL